MPGKYDKLGIVFQYPDNWSIDEEDALSGGNSVTVRSPEGGFWSVAVHPVSAEPAELAQAAVTAMREEYAEVEIDAVQETLAGRCVIGYDLSFYYLDLISTARIRCLRTEKASYSIYCQAEDREFERIERVFEAMATSLLSGL
jgi:hypothetical protein